MEAKFITMPKSEEIFEQIQKVGGADFIKCKEIRTKLDLWCKALFSRFDYYQKEEATTKEPEVQHSIVLAFHSVCIGLYGLTKALQTKESYLYFTDFGKNGVDAEGKKISEKAKEQHAAGMTADLDGLKNMLEKTESNIKEKLYELRNSMRN